MNKKNKKDKPKNMNKVPNHINEYINNTYITRFDYEGLIINDLVIAEEIRNLKACINYLINQNEPLPNYQDNGVPEYITTYINKIEPDFEKVPIVNEIRNLKECINFLFTKEKKKKYSFSSHFVFGIKSQNII
jgi:hemerythrin superfamily protein